MKTNRNCLQVLIGFLLLLTNVAKLAKVFVQKNWEK